MLTRELLARLPKADLHNHLDGSLRPETLIDLAGSAGVVLPSRDPDTIRHFMLVKEAGNLEQYLARFAITVPVLQTPEALERVAYELAEDAARDGVRYIEVRYCPALSCARGMTLTDVVQAELRGLRAAERDFDVQASVINCSLRHFDPALSLEIASVSVALRDQGVVGFDLAGGEAGRPASQHREAFDLAEEALLGITIHAGEAAGPEYIADAVHRCHAHRLGHGTRLGEDLPLMRFVRDRRIPIEINLSSNVQTQAVASLEDHPLRLYYDEGLVVTLSTDNQLMSGTTLSREYWLAHEHLGFSLPEIRRMMLAGFESAFLPWPEKQRLLARVKDELALLAP
jgi:adenosine deaminase